MDVLIYGTFYFLFAMFLVFSVVKYVGRRYTEEKIYHTYIPNTVLDVNEDDWFI